MNTDTGETMPLDRYRLQMLRVAGYAVVEPEPGRQVVLLPDPVYRREERVMSERRRREVKGPRAPRGRR